ncbi:MAG: cupin domain-containing protein [Pseudomonadota bacterium]
MQISHLAQAPQFQSPNHWDMRSFRLQEGGALHGPERFNISLSYFLPGGGAGLDASTTEKVYIVLDGQMEISSGGEVKLLNAMDSCVIRPNIERSVSNPGVVVARMLVITTMPEKAA